MYDSILYTYVSIYFIQCLRTSTILSLLPTGSVGCRSYNCSPGNVPLASPVDSARNRQNCWAARGLITLTAIDHTEALAHTFNIPPGLHTYVMPVTTGVMWPLLPTCPVGCQSYNRSLDNVSLASPVDSARNHRSGWVARRLANLTAVDQSEAFSPTFHTPQGLRTCVMLVSAGIFWSLLLVCSIDCLPDEPRPKASFWKIWFLSPRLQWNTMLVNSPTKLWLRQLQQCSRVILNHVSTIVQVLPTWCSSSDSQTLRMYFYLYRTIYQNCTYWRN
jgi:hypothetical protein